MSKAIRLAILGQKAAKSALVKSQILSPSSASSLAAVQQRRNKSYYGEPKTFKQASEVLLTVDDPEASKWKLPPGNCNLTFLFLFFDNDYYKKKMFYILFKSHYDW